MNKITQEQLISSLSQLKEIKPNKEWAVLLKSKILTEKQAEIKIVSQPAQFAGIVEVISSAFFRKKLVYAFAAFLFIVMGVFGFDKLMPSEKAPQQTAFLATQNMVTIKEQIKTTVKDLTKNLKDNPAQDPQEMRILVKTLADIPGDVVPSQDMKDLYQTVVQNQIADLQKATLTDEQKITLAEIEELYNQGKYMNALEKILLISQ